jgi:hypothetical protein
MHIRFACPAEAKIALIAGLGLACAMGIGRFALTPILPLMLAMDGWSAAQGKALAIANYLGYLLGALSYITARKRLSNAEAACLGLVGVFLTTLGMTFADPASWRFILRALSGVSSAYSLIGLSSWTLTSLLAHQRKQWSGWIFAGVGAGISMAGLLVTGVTMLGGGAKLAWLALAGAAGAMTALVYWVVRRQPNAEEPSTSSRTE